jgi:Hint domain
LPAFIECGARINKKQPAKDRDRHCFLKGTMIRTAEGDKKIEAVAAGNLLPTVFGGTRPIQWIGRYRYRKSDRAKA